MDIKIQLKTIDLLAKLMQGNIEKIRSISYIPQKPPYNSDYIPEAPLEREIPEKEGISPKRIYDFIKEFSADEEIGAHSIMIVRNGKVIAEAGFTPYRLDIPHISHSLCKSIVGLAVGIAIDQGLFELDTKITDIFHDQIHMIQSFRFKNLTIRHLLTMSSGASFNEIGEVLEEDWVKAYFESTLMFEPGTQFAYNSANTYILAAAIKEKTGKGLLEFLEEPLLKPLGIHGWFWETCPKGIEKGGWGLNLRTEDMAKLGQIMLQEGMWNGRQLISKEWIRQMGRKQIDTPEDISSFGYGYQTWMCPSSQSYQFNGMLGQNVVILPRQNMVVVTTCGSTNLFPSGPGLDLIMKYFGEDQFFEDSMMHSDLLMQKRLDHMLSNLEFLVPFEEVRWVPATGHGWKNKKKRFCPQRKEEDGQNNREKLSGMKYEIADCTAGILPLFIQVLHSNYSSGIQRISFGQEKDLFYMDCTEKDEANRIYIGFEKPLYSDVHMNGESYLAGTKGKFTKDEDNNLVLKLWISFVETSNTRVFKFFFREDQIELKLDEMPALSNVMDGLASMINQKEIILKPLNALSDTEFAAFKTKQVLCPVVYGHRIQKEAQGES